MKKSMLALLAASCLLFTGCTSTTPTISPALVRQGVATGVAYGCGRYPQAVPGVKIAKEVICSAATGTDLNPAAIVAAVKQASPGITPETTLIVNGALVLYIGIYNSFAADAVNQSTALRGYLNATCSGIEDGLPSTSMRATSAVNSNWPLVR